MGQLSVADPRHGQTAGYVAGCRCEPCRAANREYRRKQREAGIPDPKDRRHGTVGGYTNYGCRCDRCVDGMRTWDTTRRRPTRKEEVRATGRAWYSANKQHHLERIRTYRREHPDVLAEQGRSKRQRKSDQIREWSQSPRGKAARRKAESARRARKRGSDSTPSGLTVLYRQIIAADPCSYCGQPSEQVDHVHPIAAGGDEDWTNLAPACASCNASKGAKSLLDFLIYTEAVRGRAAANRQGRLVD